MDEVKNQMVRDILKQFWGQRVQDIGELVTDFEIWLIEYLESFEVSKK